MDKNNIKEFFRKSSTYPLNWVPESDSFFLGRKAAAIGRALHQDIVAELSSVATGSIVLDAGVGKGRLVTDILSKKPKLLVCVDLSKYMLSICKDSTKKG
jgi:SAM-dependent methyltransferase